jgi:hypothetical protein
MAISSFDTQLNSQGFTNSFTTQSESSIEMNDQSFWDFVNENSIILNELNNPSNLPQVSLTVTTFEDQNDGSSLNGLSLRDAILQAQNNPSSEYIIYLGAGIYNLYIQGSEDSISTDDLNLRSGDLDLDGKITIIGLNPQETIINASDLGDRIFHVRSQGFLNIENLTIQGGQSTQGGGIFVEAGATANLKNSIVKSNETTGAGGGISNDGILEITASQITGNFAQGNGGGISNTGTLIIASSTIDNNSNSVNTSGGGIYTVGGTLTMTNSTVSSNLGEGIFVDGTNAFIVNSTITANDLGITSINPSGDGGVILQNSIVASNTNSFGIPSDIDGFFTLNSANNLIGNGNGILLNGVNGNITGDLVNPLDPKLTPLQDNIGPTPTHALLPDSPAINAGNNDLAVVPGLNPIPLTTDQRGLARISNNIVDMGSVEYGAYDSLLNSGLDNTPGLVYRFYNPASQGHFFTTNESERNTVLGNPDWGYVFESYGFLAEETPGDNLTPVYRFYNPVSQGHFFTTSEVERQNVLANPSWGYQEEGIGFYAYGSQANGTLPVYRFYNPTSQGHFFTISEEEKNSILSNPGWGYNFEGVGFYANTI